MTETELAALCAAITPPDEAARAAAHAHWASLATVSYTHLRAHET